MDEVWEAYREDLEEIESQIQQNFDSEIPLINEIAAYILNGGGKRVRPLLLILCARLSGLIHKEDLILGSLVEFIHTATLLHDDVLDEADLRRGQDTARRIWGNQASILVGDYLYSRAMCQIAAFQNHDVNDAIAEACRKMAEGEILELCSSNQPTRTETEYLRIIEFKTGALVAASCRVGGIIGGASQTQQAALFQFGLHLGIAFQLTDDQLDYAANGSQLGKTLGQDFRQGMVTLPLLHLLQAAPPEVRSPILEEFKTGTLEDQDLFHLIGLMEQYGSLAYAAARAQEYIDAALSQLNAFPDCPAKRSLSIVADYMVNRNR